MSKHAHVEAAVETAYKNIHMHAQRGPTVHTTWTNLSHVGQQNKKVLLSRIVSADSVQSATGCKRYGAGVGCMRKVRDRRGMYVTGVSDKDV